MRPSGTGLECPACPATYASADGVLEFFPWTGSAPDPRWARWRRKLDLLQRWREQTWTESPSSAALQERVDGLSAEFFQYLDAPKGGAVLEIGCGNGGMSRFLLGRRYWGLDPLVPKAPVRGDAVLLRGVGERLPFKEGGFDTVLLLQTLDHSFDPAAVLTETHRVMKAGGVLGISQSLKHEPSPVPRSVRLRTALSRWRAALLGRRRIDAAETKTHPLDAQELLALVRASFVIESTEPRGQVLFIRARKPETHGGGTAAREADRIRAWRP